MKRYVFYDKTTGEILHTHHVVSEGHDFVEVRARDLDAMVERMVDTSLVPSLVANVQTTSSRATAHIVDTNRRRVVTSRVRRSASRAQRRQEVE